METGRCDYPEEGAVATMSLAILQAQRLSTFCARQKAPEAAFQATQSSPGIGLLTILHRNKRSLICHRQKH